MINEIEEMIKAKESGAEISTKLIKIDSQEEPKIIHKQVPAGDNRLVYYSMLVDEISDYIFKNLKEVDKIIASSDINPILVFSPKFQFYPNPNINDTYLIGHLNEIPFYISPFIEKTIYIQSPVKEDGSIDYIEIKIED